MSLEMGAEDTKGCPVFALRDEGEEEEEVDGLSRGLEGTV